MNFEFTDEQKMIREMVRNFAKKEVAPLAAEIDRDSRFPSENFSRMAELGLLGVTVGLEYDGSAVGLLANCLVIEELSKACASTALVYMTHSNLCTDNIYRNGSEYQKKKYLPLLVSGKKIGAMCMTEPGAGSDALSMTSHAERKGTKYILNGSKTFITNSPVAGIFLVYAKTDPAKGPKGLSAFIVERDFPGISVSKKFDKMGLCGSPTAEVVFEDCEVPEENLLGEENKGVSVFMSGLDSERVASGAISIGIAQELLMLHSSMPVKGVSLENPLSNFN